MNDNQNSSGLLRHVHALNSWNPHNFIAWFIDDVRVGYLKPFMRNALAQWPDWFQLSTQRVDFRPGTQSLDERSRILDIVVHELVDQSVIRQHLNEVYPVTGPGGRTDLLARLDRGAAGYFGIKTYGQHLNGYVRHGAEIRLWVARRDATRVHFPNKLDNIVAGGLPQNLSLAQNLIKECHEEASIPEHLAATSKPVGAINYCREIETGLKPDTLYCYDLELPQDFQPVNSDGEVAEFMLMEPEEVLALVRDTDEFKLNCNLVFIDFFIRHGIIGPDEAEYLSLIGGLHSLD